MAKIKTVLRCAFCGTCFNLGEAHECTVSLIDLDSSPLPEKAAKDVKDLVSGTRKAVVRVTFRWE